ncbi:MAG: hypothetical protein HC905_20405 [Bacteroidales bacterium]|nr:hypothetical protein [Bacteroidales bacterium]
MQQDLKNSGSLNSNAVYCIYRDNTGIYWIGTYGGGINVYNKYKYKFMSYRHNPDNITSLGPNPVLAVFQDSKQRVWVGNDGGGLNLFDIETGTFQHFRHDKSNPNSISSDVIVCINEDANGNILLGTYNGGFMVFNPEKNTVKRYYTIPGDHSSLSGLHVWNILRDNKNRIWLGVLGEGVDMFNPENETFTHYVSGSNKEIPIRNTVVMHINQDTNGDIWFGSEGGGIEVYSEITGKVKVLNYQPGDPNSLSNNDIKCIHFTKDHVFVGTNGGGLDIIKKQDMSITHFTAKNGLPSNAVMGLLMDEHNNLWISTTKGMCWLNTQKFLKEGIWEFKNYDKNDGLAGNEFKYNAQFKLEDGRMIFGGIDGISVFHPDSIKDNPVIPPIVFTDFKLFNVSQKIGVKGSPLDKHINETNIIGLNHKKNMFSIEFAALNYTATSRNQYKYKLEGFDKDWIDAGKQRFAMYTNLSAGKYLFRVIASNNDGIWNTHGRSLTIRIYPPWWKTWWFYLLVIASIAFLVYFFIKARIEMVKRDKALLEEKIKEGEKIINEKIEDVERQKEEIRLRDIREKEMRFYTEGLAKFSIILAELNDDVKTLSKKFLSELIEYVGGKQGLMYVANNKDQNDVVLELYAHYCADLEDLRQSFLPGEGYVGMCFKDQETVIVDNVPKGYMKISSGLGQTSPKK